MSRTGATRLNDAVRAGKNRCGAEPPAELKTRTGQQCILQGSNHREHKSFDLKWPNLNYVPVVGGLLEGNQK